MHPSLFGFCTAKLHRIQLRRTLARWNQRTLVRTFTGLVMYAKERIRVRALLLKVLGRVDNYAIYRGFSKWRDYIAIQMKSQMDKVLLISKMTSGLYNQKDVAQLVNVVMRQACDLLDADRATLFVVRESSSITKTKFKNMTTLKTKKELYTFAADGTDPIVIPIDAGLVGQCVASGSVSKNTKAKESVHRVYGKHCSFDFYSSSLFQTCFIAIFWFSCI